MPPSECVSRLAAAIDVERSAFFSWTGMFGSKPVIGSLTETSLRIRKRIRYRNSFQSSLVATLRPEAGGTVISGAVAMDPFVRVFMYIWFGALTLMGGAAFFGAVSEHQDAWVGVKAPLIMLIFGVALVSFGRNLALKENRFLKGFLIETLNAHAMDSSSPE